MQRSIAIDIGNTRIKVGFFESASLLETTQSTHWEEIWPAISQFAPQATIISSVKPVADVWLTQLQKIQPTVCLLDYQLPLPIQNHYGTPHTLGMDRVAGVVGGQFLYPNQAILVIDAGTCITYDYLNPAGEYQGGIISPGLQMRAKAMHEFTAKLPLLSADILTKPNPALTGNNTQEAMASGVFWGIVAEMNGIIEMYQSDNQQLKVLITGGDAIFFETKLKPLIFAHPNLILTGLFRILQYNVAPKNKQ
ncbi:MAG TPA: pantothenate kinase [Microscillaceae bacterium]|jgi:type III pantothenate kinase|nr:pantothenate kinase [Microscillaceae bacterium]